MLVRGQAVLQWGGDRQTTKHPQACNLCLLQSHIQFSFWEGETRVRFAIRCLPANTEAVKHTNLVFGRIPEGKWSSFVRRFIFFLIIYSFILLLLLVYFCVCSDNLWFVICIVAMLIMVVFVITITNASFVTFKLVHDCGRIILQLLGIYNITVINTGVFIMKL